MFSFLAKVMPNFFVNFGMTLLKKDIWGIATNALAGYLITYIYGLYFCCNNFLSLFNAVQICLATRRLALLGA